MMTRVAAAAGMATRRCLASPVTHPPSVHAELVAFRIAQGVRHRPAIVRHVQLGGANPCTPSNGASLSVAKRNRYTRALLSASPSVSTAERG